MQNEPVSAEHLSFVCSFIRSFGGCTLHIEHRAHIDMLVGGRTSSNWVMERALTRNNWTRRERSAAQHKYFKMFD